MPPRSSRYTQDDVFKALDEVSRGISIAAAAKKYGIPRITLLYKVHGKHPVERRMGPKSYLTTNQEEILVKWIISISKAGFPVTMNHLQNCVKKIVTDLGLKTPFKHNRPGRHWCEAFKNRHPEISSRVAQNLTETRASVTKERLQTWFKEVFTYLESNDQVHILNQPERIFNCDETAFFLNPKGGKVLAPKGDKTVYQKVNPDEKECLTVLLTGNSAGDTPPPMVVFKYERIPRDLALSVPSNWGIGRSENGWMTGETFYEFMSNIFNPWLEEKNIEKPVILFIDGHTSHLTLHTSKFCSNNGIILVALYPNATHLIQPMDVAVFRSLKGNWKEAVHEWRLENIDQPVLRKTQFCPLLKEVLDKTLKPSIFRNGFRKCGLVPWNPQAVEVNERTTSSTSQQQAKEKMTELEKGLKFIEKHIHENKLILFKNQNVWTGNKEDASLFLFWQNIHDQYETSKDNYRTHMRQTGSLELENTVARIDNSQLSTTLLTASPSVITSVIPEILNADSQDSRDNISDPNTNTMQQILNSKTPNTPNDTSCRVPPVTTTTTSQNFLSQPTMLLGDTRNINITREELLVKQPKNPDTTVTDVSQISDIVAGNEGPLPPFSPISSPVNFLNDAEVEEALSNLEPVCPLVPEKNITPGKSDAVMPNFITPAKYYASDRLRITALTNITNTIPNASCNSINKTVSSEQTTTPGKYQTFMPSVTTPDEVDSYRSPITPLTMTTNTITNATSTPKNIVAEPMPCSSSFDPNIPTPFKRILFWPQEKQIPLKKRKIEKIPSVVTSNKWQEYYDSKEKKKNDLILEKQKKAEERKKKKEKKEADKIIKQDLKEKRKIAAAEKKKQIAEKAKSKKKGKETKPVQIVKKTLFDSDSDTASETNLVSFKFKSKMAKPAGTTKNRTKKTCQNNPFDSSSESEYDEWQESRGSTNDVTTEEIFDS